MVQTTQSRERNYLGATKGASSPVRHFLIQSQVSSIVMVVRNIIRDKSPQMEIHGRLEGLNLHCTGGHSEQLTLLWQSDAPQEVNKARV